VPIENANGPIDWLNICAIEELTRTRLFDKLDAIFFSSL
jgi:hypothetical protein